MSVGAIYEQNLAHCEVMDSILKGDEYTVIQVYELNHIDSHTTVSVYVECHHVLR